VNWGLISRRAGIEGFFLLHNVRTTTGVHPISYLVSTLGSLYLKDEAVSSQAYQSSPSSAKVKNVCNYTTTSCFFMVWCLMKHRNNLILYLTMLQNCSKCRLVTSLTFEHSVASNFSNRLCSNLQMQFEQFFKHVSLLNRTLF
jgi:hypothetical protein